MVITMCQTPMKPCKLVDATFLMPDEVHLKKPHKKLNYKLPLNGKCHTLSKNPQTSLMTNVSDKCREM